MSSCPESLRERQESELQLLEAIYVNDVTDLRTKDAWKVPRPPELEIVLRPQESVSAKECYVSVALVVKCCTDYPEKRPELKLDNVKGLSTQQGEQLLNQLEELADSLTGEVMVLELCQHAQEYLRTHNQPPLPSFYEEMMANQRKQEEIRAQEKRKLQEIHQRHQQKQIEAVEEEIQKRKEETRKLKTISQQEEEDSERQHKKGILKVQDDSTLQAAAVRRRSRTLSDNRTNRQTSHEDAEAVFTHTGTASIAFKDKTVIRGTCLGHSSRGSAVYACLERDSGHLLALTEWSIRWRIAAKGAQKHATREEDDRQAAKFMPQVRSVESEFNAHVKLSHKHLLTYYALTSSREGGRIVVSVLTDYAGGGSLVQYLQRQCAVPMQLLQRYTAQALEALAYLHSKSVTHKDLRFSSLLLDSGGNIQLADFSINKRLSEIVSKADSTQRGVHFEDTDMLPTLGKGGKKGDIYRLGIILLSLAEGSLVQDPLARPSERLPAALCDLLQHCLEQDERTRWSASQLLEHSFVKTPIAYNLLTAPGANHHRPHTNHTEAVDKGEEEGEEVIGFIPSADSGSRLQNEFAILKSLGKGAFGDVIKVRNKLDQCLYAIKRIPLNPQRKMLNKKITREVKLLSRLNHENVVRYYNSWIENSEEPVHSDSSNNTSTTTDSTPVRRAPPTPEKTMNFGIGIGDIEKDAPPPVSDGTSDWSSSNHSSSLSDDSDDDDDVDLLAASFMMSLADSDEDEVVFEGEAASSMWHESQLEMGGANKANIDQSSSEQNGAAPCLQFLYIQMEFCEKSTLRTCIDTGLWQDVERVWRLFREIIEGLVHIHEQGMIHRDLKPVNIFLDSNDHVKIGDFGLATGAGLQPTGSAIDFSHNASATMDGGSEGALTGDGGMTGQVGTALYVSPEIMDGTKKLQYSQKVDVYSLGMIFFEMCYRPLETAMERIRILGDLRKTEINLPGDFDIQDMPKQTELLKWLLQHEPSKRPTSHELLQSELLPVQEAELTEVLEAAISKPQERGYRRILDALFNQPTQEVISILYDHDLYKAEFNVSKVGKSNAVRNAIKSLFRRHGAQELSTPLLLPKSRMYEAGDACVRALDRSGTLVQLPYDLRVPFARYLAKAKVCQLRRYCVDKVFYETRLPSSHPKEITMCSFDIVTPNTAGLVPDAEVLHVVFDLMAEFPLLQKREYTLRLNHTSLLTAILLHSAILAHLHEHVLTVLTDAKREKRHVKRTRLLELQISEHSITQLFKFIEMDKPFDEESMCETDQVSSMLKCITKTRTEAGTLAKRALSDLKDIIAHATLLGCKMAPHLSPGLLHSVRHFRGVMFHVAKETRTQRKRQIEVLAYGGRYDSLIERFWPPGSLPVNQTAVGVNIFLDKVVSAAIEDKGFESETRSDVYVTSLSHKADKMVKEKLSVLKELRGAGIPTQLLQPSSQVAEELLFQTPDDIIDFCRSRDLNNVVVLRDGEVPSHVRLISREKDKFSVISREKDKFSEKKVSLKDLVDQPSKFFGDSNESSLSSQSAIEKKAEKVEPPNTPSTHHSVSGPPFNINFVQPENSTKLSKNTRRLYESRIHGALSASVKHISSCCKVEVVALELNSLVVNTIASVLVLKEDDETQFKDSLKLILEEHPRHRKYLTRVFDVIQDLYFERYKREHIKSVFIVYGLKDDHYRFLL